MSDKQIDEAKRALNFILSNARCNKTDKVSQTDLDEAHAAVWFALERQRVPKEVRGLLKEVVGMHRDPESYEYDQCDQEPCAWCEAAQKWLAAAPEPDDG